MKRTALLTILIVALFTTAVAAAPVSIRVSGWSAGPEIEALMREQLDAFEAQNPDIKVRYEPIPVDYLTANPGHVSRWQCARRILRRCRLRSPVHGDGRFASLDDFMKKTGTVPTYMHLPC